MWKAAESVACLVRVGVESPVGIKKIGVVDVDKYTPVVRRGGLSTGTGRWRSVQKLPGFQ